MTWVSPLKLHIHCPNFPPLFFKFVFLLETMPLHTHLPKYHESIEKSCDFICQGQDFDICNMWFSLLLMETGWVKCTTSGYVIKHTRTGPHGCCKLRHTCVQALDIKITHALLSEFWLISKPPNIQYLSLLLIRSQLNYYWLVTSVTNTVCQCHDRLSWQSANIKLIRFW